MAKPITRVLIVEDDEDWQMIHRKTIEDLKYEAIVAEGVGNDLIKDAIEKCKDACCHIAIIDMHLRNQSDPEDLSGIDEVAINLSPASVIVVSGYVDLDIANKKSELAESMGMVVKFTTKRNAAKELPTLLTNLALRKSSAANGISPKVSESFAPQLDRFLERMGYIHDLERGREVLGDLLVQLYDDAKGFELKSINPSPSTASTALVRNSFVCQVELQGSSRMDQVVKFARPNAIVREHQNYKKYIHHHVPWQSYAGLDEHPALSCQIGAIGLDMVVHPELFSHRYRLAAKTKAVDSIRESIQYLSKNWTHYTGDKSSSTLCDGKDFLSKYVAVWDRNKDPGADTFEKRLADAAPEERWNHDLPANLIPDSTLPNPIYWLKERSSRETIEVRP